MVQFHQMFLSERREFPSTPCLAGKQYLMIARVSMLLKLRASPDMLPFSLCNKKSLAIRHMNRLIFPTTISIPVLRHRQLGRAKDLSAPPRISCCVQIMSQFQKSLNAMFCCEMWVVLFFMRSGNIVCRVTGKTLAVGVREHGAGEGIWV